LANIAAETDASGAPPAFALDGGDSVAFSKASGTSMWATKRDGSGDADAGADSPYTKDQTDADEVLRFTRKGTDRPFHSIPLIYARGNHDAAHGDIHYDANNGASTNNSAIWALNSLRDYIGHPTGLPTSKASGSIYWTAAEAQALGQYFAFERGPCLFCVLDAYFASRLSVTDPSITTTITYDAVSDWTLGTPQFDFFFHPTTGAVATTTKKWIVILVHNLVGGLKGGGPSNYGRGGASYVKNSTSADGVDYIGSDASEWMDTIHPRLVSICPNRCVVFKGHDHTHQMHTVEGIAYVTMMTPGQFGAGAFTSVYGEGFGGQNLYSQADFGHKPNAGYYRIDAGPASLTVKAKRTYVDLSGLGVTEPSDGITTNGAVIETLTLGGGGMGRGRGRTRGRILERSA